MGEYLSFLSGPVPGFQLPTAYSPGMVFLSYLVAAFAAFTALDFAGRVRYSGNPAISRAWIAAGAVAMGAGIWAMHFVAMLAFRLPIVVTYDLSMTLVSLAVAIGFSGFALAVASRHTLTLRRLVVAGPLMGLGVVAMHYIGMAAIRAEAMILYAPGLFAASIANALACSTLAIWLVFRLGGQAEAGPNPLMQVAAALIMGVAIAGMHYIAMMATVCVSSSEIAGPFAALDGSMVEVVIGAVAVLAIAVSTTISIQNHAFRLRLLRQNQALVEEIAERRRTEAELVVARDQATEASRAKSRFLANMSHEIRTPMNGVLGMTQLLLRTQLDDRQRRYANGAKTAGDLLLAILNDILDFSKVDAGKLELESVPFLLPELVHGVVATQEAAAQCKGLHLSTAIAANVPRTIHGDPVRLKQILINLCSNAVKFSSHGTIRLDVSMHAPSVLRFDVQDEGIGIKEEDLQRLFQPFVQADSSTTRKFGGTGLGLAISKQLVDLLDGEIGCESVEGSGSTFWFTVPLPRIADAEASEPASFEQRSSEEGAAPAAA